MTPELGHVALIIALCLAVAQAAVPMVGSFTGHRSWMGLGHSLALGQFVFIALSFACLANAFLQDDFSVAYVANNSNTLLPDRFKFSAVWGAHEGSLLLWVLMLAGWSAAVALFSRQLPPQLVARVLSILGFVAIGFIVFLLMTSNPFDRLLPVSPVEGRDLNPLLQDFGLIVHPPMLYMGYVGFAVPFAFAIAALIGSQFDSAWARWARPWINVAWAFLTVGIGLGSWWAYYELGWGGWWFWDPVENASFMPWLVGTALVHSISATEKRGVFRSWTLLLAIFAFSLSLLGAFLVRSGILTSVHAFASDPERGAFILGFIALVIGGSLTLFALRGPAMQKVVGYGAWSREMMLLLNNILLVSSMAMILVGTLYPLLADVLNLGKISVGPPYFNFFFVPLMSGLAIAVGFAAFTRWKKTDPSLLLKKGTAPALVSAILALVLPLFLSTDISWVSYSFAAVFTLLISFWVIAMSIEDFLDKTGGNWVKMSKLSGSYWGMLTAHIGLAVCVLGVGLSSTYSKQRDVRMEPGDRADVSGYQFEFVGVKQIQGPNYLAYRGEINVESKGSAVATMLPEKRNYRASGQVMTEAAIDGALHRDLYVSLGEPLTGEAWAVRLYVKPFVRCIWLGALMIALGGLLAAGDKRYRRRAVAKKVSLTNSGPNPEVAAQ
ncbi:MAG: heme lyase CcmF/NrfE family subunit [Porticoccaceae bacterium]|nr:heme lyase CcmF/NrfE family subunit [Porticoccaceae bacterium]